MNKPDIQSIIVSKGDKQICIIEFNEKLVLTTDYDIKVQIIMEEK